jgi:hypothetical protein
MLGKLVLTYFLCSVVVVVVVVVIIIIIIIIIIVIIVILVVMFVFCLFWNTPSCAYHSNSV